jgi:predicted amidohydrolase YtcJ
MSLHNIYLFTLLLTFNNIAAQKTADIIIYNGKITTLDDNNTQVQALAISKNLIMATGTNDQIMKLRNKHTKMIDAAGGTALVH